MRKLLSIFAITIAALHLFSSQTAFALYPEPFSDEWELDRKVDDLNSKLDDLKQQIQYAPKAQANQMIWQMGLSVLSEKSPCASKLNEGLRAFMQKSLEEKKQFYFSSEVIGLPFSMQQNVVESRFGVRMTMLQNLLALRPQALSECIRDSSAQPVAPTIPTRQAVRLPDDVSRDTWYSEAVSEFVQANFISNNEPFRPSDLATRADLVSLVVKLNGGVLTNHDGAQTFDDVPTSHPAWEDIEEAAAEKWLSGSGNCYGRHPCYAHPDDPLNRAEAAAFMQRAFGLKVGSDAPTFTDVKAGAWYADIVRTAASLCILQGDQGAGTVRPSGNMNRGEMVVMLWRVDKGLIYPNCK